jgi:general secretion pathway protein D
MPPDYLTHFPALDFERLSDKLSPSSCTKPSSPMARSFIPIALSSLLACGLFLPLGEGFAASEEPQPPPERAAVPEDTSAIRRKLERIIIPKLEFREATVREAVEFLKEKSAEVDVDSPAGARGVNIELRLGKGQRSPAKARTAPGTDGKNAGEARINVSLTNIPLIEALKYVTGLANLKFKVEPKVVAIVPLNIQTDVLVTKEWKIPRDLIPNLPAPDGEKRIIDRETAKNWLIANGVVFNDPASAIYIARSSRLIVRNTQDQLDLVDVISSSSGEHGPSLIEIECHLLDIPRDKLEDALWESVEKLFNAPGSKNIFVSGGDIGVAPEDGLNLNELRSHIAPTGLTVAGFRSRPGATTVCALTDPQYQMVLRAFAQKLGADQISVPKVTVKSGQRAFVEIVREWQPASEETPPQVMRKSRTPSAGKPPAPGHSAHSEPSAPAEQLPPNDQMSVALEILPVIGPDGFTIDLTLSPRVIEFDGRAPNGRDHPVFTTRIGPSSVSVYDGSTVMFSDLLRDDLSKLAEAPNLLLGKVPVLGRAVGDGAGKAATGKLMLFVSVRLISTGPEPVRGDEKKAEPIPTPKPSPKPSKGRK